MAIYILEGSDGTGKSTCFEQLKRYMPKDVIFIKESYTSSAEDKMARVRRLFTLIDSGKTVVYDRATAVDDFVYELVIDEQKSILQKLREDGLYKQFLEVMQKVHVLYFTCDDDVIKERLEYRGDEFITAEHVATIKRSYEFFFTEHNITPYRIDTSDNNITNVAAQVVQIIAKKQFKLAHIVPRSCLSVIAENGYQMCLANIVKANAEYADFYANLRKVDLPSSNAEITIELPYVLMDNGAAEGNQLSNAELILCYEKIKPSEVVLPDTLLNGKETLYKSKEALQFITQYYNGIPPFKFMAVPQGKTLEEWEECAEQMVQWPQLTTLGISKFLQMELGYPQVRYEAAEILDKLFKKYGRYDIEVHLLGCNESPAIISSIAKAFPFVRGCDSAYGYICAQDDKEIYSATSRPSGEIDFIDGVDYLWLKETLCDFELAAEVYDNRADDSWLG